MSFIPIILAVIDVDVDVAGSTFVRQRGSLKGTASTISQPVFAVLR